MSSAIAKLTLRMMPLASVLDFGTSLYLIKEQLYSRPQRSRVLRNPRWWERLTSKVCTCQICRRCNPERTDWGRRETVPRKASKTSARAGEAMKERDQYHKWVEWSEEDQTYIGKCPDLITGIHGDDPVRLYSELCEVIDDVIRHFTAGGRPLPRPRIRPMQEVV